MSGLDLADIQGNIHRPYGRFGFPHTRHFFFNIANAPAGRRFVEAMRPRVTTAEPWGKRDDGHAIKPAIALNIGFTFMGLHALDLPTETLRLMPDEFIDGMACRSGILGDVADSAPAHWDPIWTRDTAVHVWVSLNSGAAADGSPLPEMAEWTDWLAGLSTDGVTLLDGHGSDGTGKWQHSQALMAPIGPGGAMQALPKEHFGFTDGISDPVFAGQFEGDAEALAVIGSGKLATGPHDPEKSWSALAAGEFILGQVDEGQEIPVATQPPVFARNGTFMAYRKVEQDVVAWHADMARQATVWMQVTGSTDREEAEETVRAKIVGRWQSGLPLSVAPNWAEHQRIMAEHADCLEIAMRKPRDSAERVRLAAFEKLLVSFRYGDDADGGKCPMGAHIRRANPRDMLDPQLSDKVGSSTLTNRRRILRRGLPYVDQTGEKGIVFMAICSSLFRQFEFIQQQWMNYGLDFDAGNDGCPLIGNRAQATKHVIPAGPANETTVIAADLPAFVRTRGGDYFFLPGLNALRMIAMGTVDPT